jgi:acetyl esterase/lipase
MQALSRLLSDRHRVPIRTGWLVDAHPGGSQLPCVRLLWHNPRRGHGDGEGAKECSARPVGTVSRRLGGALLLVALAVVMLPASSYALAPPVLNVSYGTNEKQVMDIYPASAAEAPLVMMAHSGGWSKGDKKAISRLALALQKLGFAAFNINYRLDSSGVLAFPMEVEDVENATRFAMAHAAEYKANPANVIIIGGSAAGQLVGSAAERMNAATAATVRGVITLSGPFDLPKMLKDFREGKLTSSLAADVKQAIGCTTLTSCETPEKQALATEWSPALQPAKPCAPWLIFNSEHEVMPLDQPAAMTATLEREACPVTEKIIPGELHAFAYWKQVQEQIVAFIHAN